MCLKMMIREIYKKNINDVYKTSIVQQTAYWSEVKRKLGLDTTAIDFKVRKNEISVESRNNCSINGDLVYDTVRCNNGACIRLEGDHFLRPVARSGILFKRT